MKRMIGALVLFSGVFLLLHSVRAEDQIYFLDPDTRKEVNTPHKGKIVSESPAGVKILIGKTEKLVPANEITQITYDTKGATPFEFRRPDGKVTTALKLNPKTQAKERRNALRDAADSFRDLASKVGDRGPAQRYVFFKIADVTYRMYLDDPSTRKDAISALEDFKKRFPDGGWEIVPVLQLLAKLHEEAGDAEKARKTLEELSDVPDVPKELKKRSDLMVSQMLMRAKNYPEAEKRLTSLLGSMGVADADRVAVLVSLAQSNLALKNLAGVETNLKSALASGGDVVARAAAYNTLGDYYRQKGQNEDAFWQYLRVDTVYNQDPAEHAKALYYLSQLYKTKKIGDRGVGDQDRSNNCKERLKDPKFNGTEWQTLAGKEP